MLLFSYFPDKETETEKSRFPKVCLLKLLQDASIKQTKTPWFVWAKLTVIPPSCPFVTGSHWAFRQRSGAVLHAQSLFLSYGRLKIKSEF